MKARFKGRKRKYYLIKILIIIIIIIISFIITFNVLFFKIKSSIQDIDIYEYLLTDGLNNYNLYDLNSLSSTEFLLKYSFGIEKFDSGIINTLEVPVIKEKEDNKELPKVYIYNTHQTESYKSSLNESFNVKNTVYTASYILKEYLSELGINAIVEDNSITDILNTNGWKYGASYKASRILLEQAKKDNPSLVFFIDLHRDSSSYEKTITEIDGEKYARLLFVVGLEHDNYQVNLDLATKLNNILKKYNASLSRGIMKKQGKGVNGKYNQDFDSNTILIEVGGQYNTIDEVNRSLKVFSRVLWTYLKDKL